MRSAAMAGLQAALPEDAWGLFQNPASAVSAPTVAISAHRAYGLKELTESAAVLTLPVRSLQISAGASGYGWSRYRQWRGLLGASARAGGLTLGAAMESQLLVLPDPYRNDHAFAAHAGFQWHLADDVLMGLVMRNLMSTGWRVGGTPLDRELRTGLTWRVDPSLSFSAEHWMNGRQASELMGGVEWKPVQVLALRVGTGSHPLRMAFGLGVQIDDWSSQIAAHRHEIGALGWTTGIDIQKAW